MRLLWQRMPNPFAEFCKGEGVFTMVVVGAMTQQIIPDDQYWREAIGK
jgi:hypothetical protein